MNTRLIFSATLAISLLAHGAFFFSMHDKANTSAAAEKSAPQVTRVVFNHPNQTIPNTPVQKIQAPKKEPIKQKQPPPKQTIKPSPQIAKPKPVSVQQEVAKIQPEPEIELEKIVDVVKKEPQQTTPPPAASIATAMSPIKAEPRDPVLTQFLVEDEKQQYKHHLLAHIESHKYYPSAARKRNIEGEILVSFILSPDGEISGIDVTGGPRMLRKAASKAVNAALPLPKPPKALKESMPIQYKMAFAIQ